MSLSFIVNRYTELGEREGNQDGTELHHRISGIDTVSAMDLTKLGYTSDKDIDEGQPINLFILLSC